MCAKWNHKFDPEVIASRLNDIRNFYITGSFGGAMELFQSQDYLVLLESSVIFDPAVKGLVRPRIIQKVVTELAKQNELNHKAIIGALSKEENLWLRCPQIKYVLATSVSVPNANPVANRTVRGCRITFSKFLPNRFNPIHLNELRKRLQVPDIPSHYVRVRVAVRAREQFEAVSSALDAIDLVRGGWNIFLNDHYTMDFGTPAYRPVNKITLGPYHTLHFPNGKLATSDIIWYERDFAPMQGKVNPIV